MITDGAGSIYVASYTLSADFPTNTESTFKNFGSVINDEEEDLGASPTDAFIIKIDEYLDNGWDEYDDNISDHRPVAWGDGRSK